MDDQPKPIQSVERVGEDARHTDGTPLPPNLPVDYRERFAAICKTPDFIYTIFAHIANGGTLITLANMWGVRHSDIAGYIADHPDFKDRYEFALAARDEWEKERCLQELRAIATVDIRQAYREDGTLKSIREMSPELAAALSSVETDELAVGSGDERVVIGSTKKVKFWDKAKAIELFMKKHGLLIERKKIEIARSLEDIIGEANADVVDAEVISSEIPKAGGDTRGFDAQNPSA